MKPQWRAQRRLQMLLALALSLSLGAGECDNNVVELDPVMLVAPEVIQYGPVAISSDQDARIKVSNPSALDLSINVSLDENSDPAFRLLEAPLIVAAGSEIEVVVRFRPLLTSEMTGAVLFRSDSKRYPQAYVTLVGSGVDLGVPVLRLEPNPLDFGSLGLDNVERQPLTLYNDGVRDLVIDEIVLDDDGAGAFRLVTGTPPGYVVAPGAEVSVLCAFNPPVLGSFAGLIRVNSNDPVTPAASLPLLGMGYDVPVAVIAALDDITTLKPFDTVRLDGSGSYSPTPGIDLSSYEWRLSVRPVGSTTTLRAGAVSGVDVAGPEARADLLLDLAGRYEVALHVVDSRGVRSAQAAILRLRAIPDEDLHIQLVWDHPTADLDLHFTRNGGDVFNHESDCYFSNRYPQWYLDSPDANPALDVDDRGGFGPENVNVRHPAAGKKTLYVHYWSARTTGSFVTTALLRIYVRGQLAAEVSHEFQSEERLWSAAEVLWPEDPDAAVLITPLGTVIDYRRPF